MNIADVQHILSDEETRDFVNHHLKYDETFNCYKWFIYQLSANSTYQHTIDIATDLTYLAEENNMQVKRVVVHDIVLEMRNRLKEKEKTGA